MKKELEELLDLEFDDHRFTEDSLDPEFLTIKQKALIYFALKSYLSNLATRGTNLSRIKDVLDLCFYFQRYAKEYLTALCKKYEASFDEEEIEVNTQWEN